MSKFLTELAIACHPGEEKFWILREPLVYETDLLTARVGNDVCRFRIIVPAGFCTDMASTARIPIVNLLWGRRAHREAVVHDYLYAIGADPDVPREIADKIFRESMISRGKPGWVWFPMYVGVALGGWMFFKKTPVDNC